MKKILLAFLVCITYFGLTAHAQCVPDTSIHTSGIFPDSATGLASGTVNQPYNQVMQLHVPADTVTYIGPFPVTVPIQSIALSSFSGMPPGLTFTCTPSNCSFPGGSNGCVLISGTPTAAGTYNPVAITVTTATLAGQPVTQYDTLNYYHIVIAPSTVGLATNGDHKFAVEQNIPNPFTDVTTIRFIAPIQGSVVLRLYNILGTEILTKMVPTVVGENLLKIDGREFASGIYMYSLTCDKTTITKRMVISRR